MFIIGIWMFTGCHYRVPLRPPAQTVPRQAQSHPLPLAPRKTSPGGRGADQKASHSQKYLQVEFFFSEKKYNDNLKNSSIKNNTYLGFGQVLLHAAQ